MKDSYSQNLEPDPATPRKPLADSRMSPDVAQQVWGWEAIPAAPEAAAEELPAPASGGGRCSLCGLPVGRADVALTVNDQLLAFCCPGCLHVFQVLCGSADGIPPNFRETDLYKACLDAGLIPRDPDDAKRREASEVGRTSPPSRPGEEEAQLAQEMTLQLQGMWCSACAWLVEEVLRKTRGVLEATVVFASDLAFIKYLPHRARAEEIVAGITRLGYHAAPYEAEADRSAEKNRLLMRLGLSTILTANIMMISFGLYGGFFEELGQGAIHALSLPIAGLAAVVLLYGGFPMFRRAALALRHGTASMDTLIAVGALAAYLYSAIQMTRGSLHLYFDTSAMLVTVVLLGKTIEAVARERLSLGMREISQWTRQKVRLRVAARDKWIAVEAVQPGDEFVVEAGERVPVDGCILAGCARLDEALLTGEPRPVTRSAGAEVMAGSLLLEGSVRFRATRVGPESTLGQILALLQQALKQKLPVEMLADRITRWLVPGVLVLAALTAGVLWGRGIALDDALLRAVTVLVITCPCALGIATPLARVAAIGVGRRLGMIIRDAEALEKLTNIDAVVFDKTGTLTQGAFVLCEVLASNGDEATVLLRAASVEQHSGHFLALEVVRKARETGVELEPAVRFEAIEGQGVKGVLETVGDVIVGNRQCLEAHCIDLAPELEVQAKRREQCGATVVFCAWEGAVQGLMVFDDALRPGTVTTLAGLRAAGLAIHMISGDSRQTVEAVADTLGIANRTGETLPQAKVAIIQQLQHQGRRIAMVGDGLNDAAALAQADVGVALGLRAKLTHDAADITLLADDPARLLQVLRLASQTMRTIRQNLWFAFGYNLLGVPLAMAGLLNPLIAVCAMLASSLTVVANTLRLTRVKSDA